jgi:tRNA pseudouridine synthase 9
VFHRHEPPVTSNAIKIIKDTNDWIAIDKPSGIPVHPSGRFQHNTITEILRWEHNNGKPLYPVHRLDRVTSGVLIIAKSTESARDLTQVWSDRQLEKIYLAYVTEHTSSCFNLYTISTISVTNYTCLFMCFVNYIDFNRVDV